MKGNGRADTSKLPGNLLLDTDRALPLIQLAVTTRSGAAQDPVGKTGLTRLVTRLMRRTAHGMTADEVDERIDSLGGSLGADVSASNSGFAGSVIARSRENFTDLLAGMVSAPGLDSDELARLQRETIAEIQELLDNDRALVRRWFRKAVFGDHPYARGAVGTTKSIAAIEPSDVTSHYQRLFTKNNLEFALAGDIDSDQACRLLEKVGAQLPFGEPFRDDFGDPEGPPGGVRLWIVDKPERTQTQILIGGLGTHAHDADHTALHVANTVFGGTFTSRLTQQVRAERGWSYGAFSGLPFDRKRQAFSMWTFPKAGDAAACIDLQLTMLRDWVKKGITEDELEYAKSYLIKSNVFSVDTAAKRMGQALDERVYDLPEGYYEQYTERVRAVTREQANEAVARRISTENLAIVVVGTEALIGKPLQRTLGDLQDYRVIPYDAD